MMSRGPRWVSVVLTIAALALAAGPGCSHSHPAGGGPDATGDDGDGGNGDGDASTIDATGTGIDATGTGTDATAIDGAAIDAQPIDSGIDAPIDAPTDASTCPTLPCDYHLPCGCQAPLVCDIDFTDLVGSSCRAVNAPGTATSTCGSFSECAGGYTCVNAGGGMRCEQFCLQDGDCAQPRGKCAIQITNQQGQPIVGATTCSSNCNPLATTNGGACPANWKCGFFTIGQTDIVDCAIPGAGVQGTPCTSDSMCGPGMMCSTFNTVQACRRVCNKTAGGQECATVPGTSCFGFGTLPADRLIIAGTEYGVCGP